MAKKQYTKAEKEKIYQDILGSRQGHLVVLKQADEKEIKKFNKPKSHGILWLCQCDCGNQVLVPTSYLQGTAGRGDYKINSCGCYAKVRHFLASSQMLDNTDEEWVYQFYLQDFEKFQLLHRLIIGTSGIKTKDWKSKEEYKEFYEYFYNDKQFNAVYNFWQNHKNENITFYDWAKPSLDHIIPTSKGGNNSKENIQFLTVFENLAKRDLTMDEWEIFKKNTDTNSRYFIDNILREEGC